MSMSVDESIPVPVVKHSIQVADMFRLAICASRGLRKLAGEYKCQETRSVR